MYGSSFTDQAWRRSAARRSTCLDGPLGADADADEEAEASADEACARADEASKLRVTAKPTQNSRLQALGKSCRMHASFGKKLAALISAANHATPLKGINWRPSHASLGGGLGRKS